MENKFEFSPLQYVLVRYKNSEWTLCQFSHMSKDGYCVMCGGGVYPICIPFRGNKHLLGTTDPYVEPKDEPKYEPKDGDFVTYIYPDGEKYVVIYHCVITGEFDCFYAGYCSSQDPDMVIYNNSLTNKYSERRLSTEEEKALFLSKLHKNGKDWDAENKQVVKLTFVPTDNTKYYYINSVFLVDNATWVDNLLDKQRCRTGNCFRTFEEAKAIAERFKGIIKNVK